MHYPFNYTVCDINRNAIKETRNADERTAKNVTTTLRSSPEPLVARRRRSSREAGLVDFHAKFMKILSECSGKAPEIDASSAGAPDKGARQQPRGQNRCSSGCAHTRTHTADRLSPYPPLLEGAPRAAWPLCICMHTQRRA